MKNAKDNYRTYVTQRLLCVAVIILVLDSSKEVKKGFKEGYSHESKSSVFSGKSESVKTEKWVGLFDGYHLLNKLF
jgi:hypothetical protein